MLLLWLGYVRLGYVRLGLLFSFLFVIVYEKIPIYETAHVLMNHTYTHTYIYIYLYMNLTIQNLYCEKISKNQSKSKSKPKNLIEIPTTKKKIQVPSEILSPTSQC